MDDRDQTYAAIRKLLASLDDPFTRWAGGRKQRVYVCRYQPKLNGTHCTRARRAWPML